MKRTKRARDLGVTAAVALLTALLTACGSQPAPTASAEAEPGIEIVATDARLFPPLRQVAASPHFANEASVWTVTRVAASPRDLCVAVTRTEGASLHIAIDVARVPWTPLAVVAAIEADQTEPTVLFAGEDYDWELCYIVALGTEEEFPAAPDGIEVNGGYRDAGQADAIRQALWERPEAFGIDRSGGAAINVQPWLSGGPTREGRDCLEGVVYQGGPRADVIVSLAQAGDGWRVTNVRIAEQALHVPEDPPAGEC